MTIAADDAVQNQAERARVFRALHEGPGPLLLPNPWDVGSARLLASLGFTALATTSGGFAATLGRLDGAVTRDEALEHAAAIAAATTLPVSADLENAFADEPAGVAETIGLARPPRPGWRAARSRTSPGGRTSPSTTWGWPASGWPRPRRRPRRPRGRSF
jgi:hypothetical protein